jgi:hypothetical protein
MKEEKGDGRNGRKKWKKGKKEGTQEGRNERKR